MSVARSTNMHGTVSGSRQGMVLLLTLVILALVSSWLAIQVSRTARLRLTAQNAQRELQSRWAGQTLQSVCLSNAKEILAASSESESGPSAVWARFTIGTKDYEVCISDEQSKYNLVTKLESGSLEEAANTLRSLAPLARVNLAELQLSKSLAGPGLGTYDQVWLEIDPQSVFGYKDQPGYFRGVTLWGDGRLNLEHATEAVCVHALDGILTGSEARRLLDEYKQSPEQSLGAIVGSLDLPSETRDMLLDHLVAESGSHSVMIRHDTTFGKATWRFAVQWVIEDTDQHGQQKKSDDSEKRVRVLLW